MDKRDYYDVLGVQKAATEDEIKKAYRTLAKKFHPDVSTEANAEAKFKEVQEAYEVLSDSQKRSQYDQFGHQGQTPFGQGGFSGGQGGFGGFDFGDIFSSFFGGQSANQQAGGNARSRPRKGSDIQRSMKISFEESIFGKKEKIKLQVYDECPACHGSGAKSPSDIHTCSKCQGTGTINVRQQTIFGVQQTRMTCDRCGGTGKEITAKCPTCNGEGNVRVTKDVEVRVPEGIETGQQIRLEGFGNKGGSGGPNGDLYIVFEVLDHNIYVREGDDILVKVPISFSQATLGADLEIPTVYGDVLLKIPAGTQSGARFVVRGKGAPNVRTKVKGDEHVIVHLATPTRITPEQKKLFEELARLDDGGKKSTQWDKFKDNFKK